MNCREALDLAPLYLSGELDGAERQQLGAHLAGCPACGGEIELQARLDARVVAAVGAPCPDAARIEQQLRRRISAAQSRRRWTALCAMAASVIVVLAAGYGLMRLTAAPGLYADAARDHRAEVVDGQPRRWRTGAAEIESLAARNGLSFTRTAGLAPAGYSLERAKICRLDGERMLHLVFTNGVRRYSVYVRPHAGAREGIRVVRRRSEQVAGFETGRFRGLVVTVGPAAECEELARFTVARL